ncbi:MAG: M18 family aminopeptidase [Bradymonadales bacterium]|nr:M18 family aminopeptidase [Bradymonadales bacterium]
MAPNIASTDQETKIKAWGMAADLLAFLDASPSAYHGAATLVGRLETAGFKRIDEREPFAIEPGGRYFIQRNDTSVIAFVPGSRPPSSGGFHLVAAHTDSPCLKLKPQAEQVSHGLIGLGIELYGSPVLATWMDRDLGLCGRLVLSPDGTSLSSRLIRLHRPVISIPNAALHMNRQVNQEGLKINPQTEMWPILAAIEEESAQPALFGRLLASAADVEPEQILGFDLVLFDLQPASFAGLEEEFVRSGRLDNLSMCHAASTALVAAVDCASEATRLAVFYDSEEVGSLTAQGARSNLVPAILERIALALGDDRQGYLQALASSILISADNAHALHPGYVEKSEPNHAPLLNGGPVIKTHAGRAYATDGYSAALFERLCRGAQVPCQRFVNRSDSPSGSTIGSMASAQLGMVTVDVGNPQLAMHSIREMGGTYDHYYMVQAMTVFFSD